MRLNEGVEMPRRATVNSAGYDFFAPEDIELKAGEWTEVGTGVFLEPTDKVNVSLLEKSKIYGGLTNDFEAVAKNWMLLLLPKSGLGFKYMVRLANTAGVVDQDYINPKDEIRAKISAEKDVTIAKGKAFMQGIFIPIGTLEGEIEPTEKRVGGFGSTEKK